MLLLARLVGGLDLALHAAKLLALLVTLLQPILRFVDLSLEELNLRLVNYSSHQYHP